MKPPVYLAAAARTPIGSLNGSLASLTAPQLGSIAIRAALERSGISCNHVDEVYMGNVLSANIGQAPAQQASMGAGLPVNIPCTTVNKVCASGMKAIMLGAQSIRQGDNQVVVAGGMESMSNTPYYLDKARAGMRYGNGQVIDGIVKDGFLDPYSQTLMGEAGELCSREYHIGREEQDQYAISSYTRAANAWAAGLFNEELVGVEVKGKSSSWVTEDEDFRKVNYEKIPSLKPVFAKDGVITAANASNINDGAAAVVLVNEQKLRELRLKPLARIVSFADASQTPEWFTTTPILAMRKALDQAKLSVAEVDYFEINEAFSCVAIVNAREMGIPADRLNIWGGAVSLGHPIGCSGARITVTLTSILRRMNGRYGMAGICNGGGGASAMIIERM